MSDRSTQTLAGSRMMTMIPEKGPVVPQHRNRVAIPEWVENDGIAEMIAFELEQLGYVPVLFCFDRDLPPDVDYLLTFGPYNRILPIWQNSALRPLGHRPVVMHWNTEGMPDLRIPRSVVRALCAMRSKIGRIGYSASVFDHSPDSVRPPSDMDQLLARYRFQGDYEYACRRGWLHVLSDTSNIYSQIRTELGTTTLYAPWGASQKWYEDLGLERDLDVLWMGKRGSQRRSRILDQVFKQLKRKGLNVYVGDNEQGPFIFGAARTRYLNRAKITLNITRTWYDDNFSRFTMACANRSLVVSEPVLPHCTEFEENVHYVSAKIEDLANTIAYYVEHEEERRQIVDNAHNLMMTELRFQTTLRKMFAAAQSHTTVS